MRLDFLFALAAWFLARLHFVHGVFINPEPRISNLTKWASIYAIQSCEKDSCYKEHKNITCTHAKSGVCFLEDICNGRTWLPALEQPLNDWLQTINRPGCNVTSQQSDFPPPTIFPPNRNARTLLVNGGGTSPLACYTHRNGSVDKIFTLLFWLKADCRNCSVLELPQTNKEAIHIRIIGDQICVNSECQGQQNVKTQWVNITVRVIENNIAIFLGETPFPVQDKTLEDVAVSDTYIGSGEVPRFNNSFQLYDVLYYRDALTLREISNIIHNIEDQTIPYRQCQCSIDYIKDSGDNNCTNGLTNYPRYNTTQIFNDVTAIVDEDPSTNWASSDHGNVTLILQFNVSLQIESVTITFGSDLPYEVSYSLFSEGQLKSFGNFACYNLTCKSYMKFLNATSTKLDVNAQTADKIQVELHRQNPQETENFIITGIGVTGRCDCNGNADNCVVNNENKMYVCTCKSDTHSAEDHCRTCSPNFYRLVDQFDCPNACQCNMNGLADSSKQCEEIGGTCICKRNVEGKMCDRCKPLTYNFGGSSSDGCDRCTCFQNGTHSCNNVTGDCLCKANTRLPSCDRCLDNSYGFYNPEGCRLCNCNIAGTIGQNMACDEYTGQCKCKDNVAGLMCDSCKPGYHSLETANQQGCKPCECNGVGTEQNICDMKTGQCPCRGGMMTNKTCTPVVTSVDPTYGPQAGGTIVTIHGSLLGGGAQNLSVYLNDTLQDLISASDTEVVFRSVPYNAAMQLTPQLKLSWNNNSSPVNLQTTFSYRENPALVTDRTRNVTTFVSGGCRIRFDGKNLLSVKYPKLEIADSSNPTMKVVANCRHVRDYVICPTPDLKGLYTSSNSVFKMNIVFDGITSSDIGSIHVQPDPHIENMGTIRFQYPFEDTISISGKGFNFACHGDDFSILTGVINCAITRIENTWIECSPAVSPPNDNRYLPIEVKIGNIEMSVGTLQYLKLQETTGFIIIISCIAAAIALIIAVIIIILCCRYHRRRKAVSSPANPDDKQLVSEESHKMNAYSDLPVPENVEENANVTTFVDSVGPVRAETIFREPKKGIVNTEAEDSILSDEFLPKVDPSLREDVRQCFIGAGHFVLGRHCTVKGKHAQLIDGSLQKKGSPVIKLTIKSVIHPVTGSSLPAWGNLALSECLRLRHYKHTHVLSMYGIGINKQHFHILYPRMSQNVLKTVVSDVNKEFSVRQLLSFGQQVAEGIDFLTSKGVTHKDVAARNCMVDDFSVVKLCDAAFSWDFYENEYEYDEQRERHLPVRWMAPESLTDGYYDMRTDVWSFGVLVWELLTRGCLPYHEATNSQEASKFITEGYILGKPDILGDNVFNVLKNCWSHENEHRPSISAVSKSLSEILETENDETYANVGEVASHLIKNSTGSSIKHRQPMGVQSNLYSTSRLSKV